MQLLLAPLAGFTDSAFRILCRRFGADGAYTEMVSAAGLRHDSVPTRWLLETHPDEPPPAVQIFGSNAEDVAYATQVVDSISRQRAAAGLGAFTEINLNAGCPMPRIRHEGSGAALVRDPEKVAELLRAMKRETTLPVTLKTRLGPWPEEPRHLELLAAAEEAGCAALIMHARFVRGLHSGPVFLDLLAETVQHAKIPVIGNGGVVDRESARQMAETGVAGLMIARAACANPWIFQELGGDGVPAAGTRDWRSVFLENLRLIEERNTLIKAKYPASPFDGDAYAMNMVRTHLMRYASNIPNAREIRKTLAAMSTLAEVRTFLQQQKEARL